VFRRFPEYQSSSCLVDNLGINWAEIARSTWKTKPAQLCTLLALVRFDSAKDVVQHLDSCHYVLVA
jgi:hypothetical protein